MLRSLSISSCATDWSGMPVQRAITSSTSARVDVEDPVRLVLVTLLELLVPPAERDLLVVVGDRLVEVLPRERVLHALDRAPELLLDLLDLAVGDPLPELHARAGLVQDVDRLVGKEAVA